MVLLCACRALRLMSGWMHRVRHPSSSGCLHRTSKMKQIRVTTRALKPKRMTALLTRHHVGRMAFTLHDRVSIALVNYLFSDGWIYARMEIRTELVTLLHNRRVAF